MARPVEFDAIQVREALAGLGRGNEGLPTWFVKLWDERRIGFASPGNHTVLAFSNGEGWHWTNTTDWIVFEPNPIFDGLSLFTDSDFQARFEPCE